MANEIKSITHKVRNPRYNENNYMTGTSEEDRWLNIWSAEIDNNNNYTITPSNNWSIPGDKISFTFTNPNKIVITGSNELNEGPAIKSNGSPTKFLNEKGNWIEIEKSDPITLTTTSENNVITKITIGHGTTISNYDSNNNSINLTLNNNSAQSILSFNEYGHITTKNNVNIPLASSTSAGLVPTTGGANNANKFLKINNDGTISWVNPTDSIPVVTENANGLAPLFGSNANGKILSIETNNNTPSASWKNIKDVLASALTLAENDPNKILLITKDSNNNTILQEISYNPQWRRYFWMDNRSNYLKWEKQKDNNNNSIDSTGILTFENTPLHDLIFDNGSEHSTTPSV